MADAFGDDGLTKLGVAGALCREYAADEKAVLGFLANALQKALPNDVELLYKSAFLGKKTLRGVVVINYDNPYRREHTRPGALQASSTHVVRGIALKTEKFDVPTWLAIVSEVAEIKASEHSSARKALQDMLGLS